MFKSIVLAAVATATLATTAVQAANVEIDEFDLKTTAEEFALHTDTSITTKVGLKHTDTSYHVTITQGASTSRSKKDQKGNSYTVTEYGIDEILIFGSSQPIHLKKRLRKEIKSSDEGRYVEAAESLSGVAAVAYHFALTNDIDAATCDSLRHRDNKRLFTKGRQHELIIPFATQYDLRDVSVNSSSERRQIIQDIGRSACMAGLATK